MTYKVLQFFVKPICKNYLEYPKFCLTLHCIHLQDKEIPVKLLLKAYHFKSESFKSLVAVKLIRLYQQKIRVPVYWGFFYAPPYIYLFNFSKLIKKNIFNYLWLYFFENNFLDYKTKMFLKDRN